MQGRLALGLRYAGALFLGVLAVVGGIEFAHRQEFVSASSTELLTNLLVVLAGVAGVASLGEIDRHNKAVADLNKFRARAEQLEDIVRELSRSKKLPPEFAKKWDRIGSLAQIRRP